MLLRLRPTNKLKSIARKNLGYVLAILSTIILLCGDVELNPGPAMLNNSNKVEINKANGPEPSTSTGIYKENAPNRDERFMRPYFKWQSDDSSIEESKCAATGNSSFSNHSYSLLPTKSSNDDFDTQSLPNGSQSVSPKDIALTSSANKGKYEICQKCFKRFTKRAIIVHDKRCIINNEILMTTSANYSPKRYKQVKEKIPSRSIPSACDEERKGEKQEPSEMYTLWKNV